MTLVHKLQTTIISPYFRQCESLQSLREQTKGRKDDIGVTGLTTDRGTSVSYLHNLLKIFPVRSVSLVFFGSIYPLFTTLRVFMYTLTHRIHNSHTHLFTFLLSYSDMSQSVPFNSSNLKDSPSFGHSY